MTGFDPSRARARTPAERAAVDAWWRGLDAEARRECRALWRGERRKQWDGVVILPEAEGADDAAEEREGRQDLLEYILAHDVAFFLDAQTYRICRRHPHARAVVRAGYLPRAFVCPLGRPSECPLERLRGAARGGVVRLRIATRCDTFDAEHVASVRLPSARIRGLPASGGACRSGRPHRLRAERSLL